MDPQVCWNELCDAYDRRDWPVVEKRASELLQWLDAGGQPPQVDAGKTPRVNALVARLACRDLRQQARRDQLDRTDH
jgi:predicted component of type VI protein secretion system